MGSERLGSKHTTQEIENNLVEISLGISDFIRYFRLKNGGISLPETVLVLGDDYVINLQISPPENDTEQTNVISLESSVRTRHTKETLEDMPEAQSGDLIVIDLNSGVNPALIEGKVYRMSDTQVHDALLVYSQDESQKYYLIYKGLIPEFPLTGADPENGQIDISNFLS